jgi:hypothetical protein
VADQLAAEEACVEKHVRGLRDDHSPVLPARRAKFGRDHPLPIRAEAGDEIKHAADIGDHGRGDVEADDEWLKADARPFQVQHVNVRLRIVAARDSDHQIPAVAADRWAIPRRPSSWASSSSTFLLTGWVFCRPERRQEAGL